MARLRPKVVCTVLSTHKVSCSKGAVASDQIIQLSGTHVIKRGSSMLRRFGFADKETGKYDQFITSRFYYCSDL